jgi:hypothetical protein
MLLPRVITGPRAGHHVTAVKGQGDIATVHRSGHTLTILREETDGKWRLARDANLMLSSH